MVREIKFRGNAINPFNDWVYGNLLIIKDIITESDEYYIQTEGERIKVHPESVGQFIGHKNRSGVDIYEGDILGKINQSFVPLFLIEWDNEKCLYLNIPRSTAGKVGKPQFNEFDTMGNIFQNTDLLN